MKLVYRGVAVLLISIIALPTAIAQENDADNDRPVAPPAPTEASRSPAPYRREEFPQWAWDLRRAEIVTIGSFPITMILTGFTYELVRFALTDLDQQNAPWFLRTAAGERFNESERIGMILTAGALSVVIGLFDYLIGRREERRLR